MRRNAVRDKAASIEEWPSRLRETTHPAFRNLRVFTIVLGNHEMTLRMLKRFKVAVWHFAQSSNRDLPSSASSRSIQY